MGDSAREPAGGHRLRVLVVEDDHDTADSLEIFLTQAGHDVRVAHDGASGLALARSCAPDVVVLDIGLPDADGYEVARQLRAEAGIEGATVIAMSGWSGEAERERSRDAGIDYHLVKPVDAEVLLQVVAAHGDGIEPERVERLTAVARAARTR